MDITASFITTQLQWREATDVLLNPSNTNGLKKSSLIRTGKICTLSLDLVQGLLGELTTIELKQLNQKLKTLLQLK